MAMGDPCERCGKEPPKTESGPFLGSVLFHNYCELCGKDLCDDCMSVGKCFDSVNGKHEPSMSDEDEDEEI